MSHNLRNLLYYKRKGISEFFFKSESTQCGMLIYISQVFYNVEFFYYLVCPS